jgi:hypothetical protein
VMAYPVQTWHFALRHNGRQSPTVLQLLTPPPVGERPPAMANGVDDPVAQIRPGD